MQELDCKENRVSKNWCFQTVVLEKTVESPLDCKEIQPVYPKGNQSWIFIGRTDAEAETPILWPRDAKNWLTKRDPDAGKGWRQEEKGGWENGWDGWMVSLTWCTWVWVSSRSWWWTGKPGVLQSMVLQRVRDDWETELNWTEGNRTDCVCMRVAVCGERKRGGRGEVEGEWGGERDVVYGTGSCVDTSRSTFRSADWHPGDGGKNGCCNLTFEGRIPSSSGELSLFSLNAFSWLDP